MAKVKSVLLQVYKVLASTQLRPAEMVLARAILAALGVSLGLHWA